MPDNLYAIAFLTLPLKTTYYLLPTGIPYTLALYSNIMPSDSFERLNFRRAHLLRSVWGSTIYIFPAAAKLTQDSALKSDRIQVLVGEEEQDFEVPRDLLANCSPVFDTLCNSAFKESIEGVIRLPEVPPLTFGSFLIWLHSCPPAVPEDDHAQLIIDLAIFSEMYQVYALKNQTSDLLQTLLLKKTIGPSTMAKVYESTPDGSILQKLFCMGFVANLKIPLPPGLLAEWESIFEQFPNFGRDYFRHHQRLQRVKTIFSCTGTCYFHDHGNMTCYDGDPQAGVCPFPDGGDSVENERELLQKRKRAQEPFQPEKKRRKTQRKDPADIIIIN